MKTTKYILVTGLVGLVAMACGSTPEESATSSTESLAEFCNTDPQQGAEITTQLIAANTPQGAGGTIKAGTYVMVARKVYTGPGGASGTGDGPYQVTMINEADKSGNPNGKNRLVIHAPVLPNGYVMQPGEQFHANGVYKTSGATNTASHTCPDHNPVPFTQFTAHDRDLAFFDYVNNQEWDFYLTGDDKK